MKETPAFKYLLIFLCCYFVIKQFQISEIIFFGMLSILSAGIIISLFLKKYNFTYYSTILASVLIINNNIQTQTLDYPNKLIPEQKAVFIGKIENIKDNPEFNILRITAKGTLDAKSLPEIENTRIVVNIYNYDNIRFKIRPGTTFYSRIKIETPSPVILNNDFDQKAYFRTNNISFSGKADASDLSLIKEPDEFDSFLSDLRISLRKRLLLLFGDKNFGIVNALISGDKSDIDKETRYEFSVTGTAHLLAVSGLHVGLISMVIYLLLGFIFNRWFKFTIFTLLISFFIILTGYQPSAIRAGLMAIAVFLGMNLERKIHPLNSVSFVAIIMILWDNQLLESAAFQMSVASVCGILLFQKIFFNKLTMLDIFKNSLFRGINTSLSVTLAAGIIVAPIVAYYFKVFSIISPIANLIVIPIISMAMLGIVAALIISFLSIELGILAANTSNFLIDISTNINSFISSYSFTFISGEITILLSILISIAIIYLFFADNFKNLIFRLVISITIIFLSTILFQIKSENHDIIIPHKNYIAFISDTSKKIENKVVIFDRKPGLKPYSDKFIKYISENYKNPKIIFSGNYGILLTDLYKSKNARFTELIINPESSYRISKLLNLNTNIIQFIDYKNE